MLLGVENGSIISGEENNPVWAGVASVLMVEGVDNEAVVAGVGNVDRIMVLGLVKARPRVSVPGVANEETLVDGNRIRSVEVPARALRKPGVVFVVRALDVDGIAAKAGFPPRPREEGSSFLRDVLVIPACLSSRPALPLVAPLREPRPSVCRSDDPLNALGDAIKVPEDLPVGIWEPDSVYSELSSTPALCEGFLGSAG